MGKKAGNRKHSKIDALDPALRETVEQMLLSGSTYSEIVDFLGENGVGISVASVCRYARAYQAEVQMLNMAQENFRRMMDELDKYPDLDTTEAIIRLTSQNLLTALANTSEEDWQGVSVDKMLREEKLSYYDLMVMRVSEGEASFNSEEQNEPINPDDCLFMEEWFEYYNEAEINFRDPAFDFFGFIDPSLGKTKRSDFSAIVTLAKHRSSGYMYVVDADIERRHPDRIIADVLAKERWLRASFGHGYRKLGAETNQFQWFLKEELAKASAKAGLLSRNSKI